MLPGAHNTTHEDVKMVLETFCIELFYKAEGHKRDRNSLSNSKLQRARDSEACTVRQDLV